MVHKEEFKYKCPWCGVTFTKVVGSAGGGLDSLGNKVDRVSDQVCCPCCGNYIKTFEGE